MEINPSEVTKILKEQIKNFGDKAEVTEVGSTMVDTSIKNKLQQIENRMVEA